jgi:hypothetical protein
LLAFALLGLRAPVAAQDDGFWSFLTPGTSLPRCAEPSRAHQDAEWRLDLLDDYIEHLSDSTDVAAATRELQALLKSECFLPAAETDRVPKPDSTIALKQWWSDGGLSWLTSYLELPELGLVSHLRPHVVLPPDIRPTLAASIGRDDPLRPLVCRLDEPACGLETLGWIERAEQAFKSHRIVRMDDDRRVLGNDLSEVAHTEEAAAERCANHMLTADEGSRYQSWRDCLETQRPKTSALPLGRIKAPMTGWLIVSGRRGHYSFCDTTGAYDLDSGAAFVYENCSALELNSDGSVDRTLTDSSRADKVRSGHVSVDNLREALWMMLLQEKTSRIQLRAEWYPLPEGLAPKSVARPPTLDFSDLGATVSTAQTVLTWRWVRSTGAEIRGEVTWPGSYDAAEDHATSLLNVAELSLVPGCVPRRPPSESQLRLPVMRVNPLDAPPKDAFYRKVQTAYRRWARAPLCGSSATRAQTRGQSR